MCRPRREWPRLDEPAGSGSFAPGPRPDLGGSDNGNSANCWPATSPNGALTDVGAYGLSASPYGTFDQGGNVQEWNEQIVIGSRRGLRGGSWYEKASNLAASFPLSAGPVFANYFVGFRVAPESAQALLVLMGALVLGAARRKRGA